MSKSSKKSSGPKTPKPAALKLAVVSGLEASAEAPDLPQAEAPEATALSVQVKKKDFVERVATRSGAKKPVVRDLTEVVLAVLGEALAQGETLVLPPLGKLSVARGGAKSGARAGGEVLHLKLKRLGAGGGAKKAEDSAEDPLAEAED